MITVLSDYTQLSLTGVDIVQKIQTEYFRFHRAFSVKNAFSKAKTGQVSFDVSSWPR